MTALVANPQTHEAPQLAPIPRHVAIIMDGNRRWALQRDLPPLVGHWHGAENLTEVVRAAADMGIQTLTVYAFSTENWNRPSEEVDGLMELFCVFLRDKRAQLLQEGVRIDAIGDVAALPEKVQRELAEAKQATAGGTRIDLVLALNYGGRDELRRAVQSILREQAQRPLPPEEITEAYISQFLDTARWGDPDLLIRTSGELRISNFLLWQLSYSEFYVTETLWPDFNRDDLMRAVRAYQQRNRRWGGSIECPQI